jgi:hypothetical protein
MPPPLRPRVRLRRLPLALLLVAGAAPLGTDAQAALWTRTRADGTEEFTNIRPGGKGWRVVPQTVGGGGRRAPSLAPRSPSSGADSGGAASGPSTPASGGAAGGAARGAAGGAVWTRQNPDGTVEFTNFSPVGARWKVLFRTGPGKAAALRGSSDLVPARDTSPSRFSRYDDAIRDQQAFYGVPESIIRAVVKTESDYDPHVVSSAGAVGLMQLMPDTARAMGVTDVSDPRQNIMGGARYLQLLARRFCRTPSADGAGDWRCSPDELVKVIAGYHAGPGAVDKYGGLPPYETTRAYVTIVLQRYEELRRREDSGAAVAAR